MTKDEWLSSDNVSDMIEYLWEQEPYLSVKEKFKKYPPKEDWKEYLELEMPLYRFHIASCRNIWRLLPQEESRKGVELAEQFISGNISWEKVSDYNYYTEGAAFCIDYDTEPAEIAKWVKNVESFSEETMQSMLSSREAIGHYSPRELLLKAAYFADHSMIYPTITPKGPPRNYIEFMFSNTLRKYVEYPA